MRPLWAHRYLIWEAAITDLRHRYAGSALGVFWNVLTPLAMLTLYAVLFTRVLVPGTGRTLSAGLFVVYLACGFLPWGAFTECVVRGTQALVANAAYLKKMPIPEQVFVAQAAVSATLGMFIVLGLIAIAAPLLGQPPHWIWVLLPVLGILWQAFGFGVSLVLSAINVFFRDVGQLLGVIFQIWMWSLPVVYLEDLLPTSYRSLLMFNPAYPFLRAVRDVFIDSRLPELWVWGGMLAWVLLASGLGLLVLNKLRVDIRDAL